LTSNAQKLSTTIPVEKTAAQIPDSVTSNASSIAEYLNSKFTLQKEKARAIFVWITSNIQYDIENVFAINFYQNSNEIVAEVLKSKKGVCMHFAELFNDIANKAGIRSFVIPGYTKQNGFVDYIPHAWCTALIDSTWCLVDPTWGSGYVQNAKFIKKMNNFYFLTNPELLIKSHIPFDLMWELLNYPITNQEFYEGKTQMVKSKRFFNFNDSIQNYIHESDIQKLISSSRRIENNGVKNSLIFDRLQHNKREIEYYGKSGVSDHPIPVL
jgi:transglutaminase/protease-like cytokinesis protein 3